MNVTKEQMKAALEKLSYLWIADDSDVFCKAKRAKDHAEKHVGFELTDGFGCADICALCLAELVNEGVADDTEQLRASNQGLRAEVERLRGLLAADADDGMVTVRMAREHAEQVIWGLPSWWPVVQIFDAALKEAH